MPDILGVVITNPEQPIKAVLVPDTELVGGAVISEIGPDGLSGYSGYSGSGYSGFSGNSGFSGYSGYSGDSTSGYSGYSSDSGYSGFCGLSGYSGFSGLSGYSGFSGSGISGYSGYCGATGATGTTGTSGYSGFCGLSGYSGFCGISGYSGFSGSGISGYSGYSGSGISGYSGYSGSGISGYSGFCGLSGYSGFSGANPGASGYSGFSGKSGYSGFSGVTGGTGTDGASGYSGYSGDPAQQSGYSGFSGKSGYSGYCGLSGYSGFSGPSGYSGFCGLSGYSGYSGPTGATGTSGYSGYCGLSGYSGYSSSVAGTSGYSGFSGSGGGTIASTTNVLAGDGSGNAVSASPAVLPGQIVATGVITPSTITASQNDYNPTGLSTATVLRLSTDAAWEITGLQGGTDGRIIIIANVGSNFFQLTDNSSSSSAANQFLNLAALNPGQTAILRYDGTDSKWRVLNNDWQPDHDWLGYLRIDLDRTVASAAGAAWNDVKFSSQLTLTGGTHVTSPLTFVRVGDTIAVTDSTAVTVDNAASVYIAKAPTQQGSVTITNAYALWIDAGTVRCDGGLTVGGTAIPSTGVINASVGYTIAGAAASGKILVGDGTNFVASTPTFPNASASSGKFIRSDGTNWIASTPTLPTSAGAAGKILASDGTNYIESTPTFPYSASATSGKVIKSDGTNWVASTETYAAPGTSGNILKSDGTNWTSAAETGGWTQLNVVTNDFTTSSTTFTNITGLVTGTLANATLYEIEIGLFLNSSSSAGLAICTLNGGSGGAAKAFFNGLQCNSAASGAVLQTADGTGTVSFNAANADGTYFAKGFVLTRGAGTASISLQIKKTTSGTATVYKGSFFRYRAAVIA